MQANALREAGIWSSEMRSFSASVILDKYLLKSVGIFQSIKGVNDKKVDAFVALARFCDSYYRHYVEYMSSKEFEEKQSLMEKIRRDAQEM